MMTTPTAAAIAVEAFEAATPDRQASLSGFRLAEPIPAGARANRASRQPELRTVGGGDALPLAIGFEAVAAPMQILLSADTDALPIDGTWHWLGLLSCWLSASLVASLLILSLR